ncbi:replication-associated recombination protein A [Clostridium sp.]|uniref:replication-associated recombination protein A n=1 Tax=Clostridium sp. TaxID=1506 RepID=UPI002628CC47|nr:replication-associated recombination protein A [Clostridium sp.]
MDINKDKGRPLADKLRPKNIEEVFGQKHVVGKGKVLNNIIDSKIIPNIILVGPPGTGKTTIARILAKESNKTLYMINGTTTNTEEIKDVIDKIGTFEALNGIILYIDEIHYLNKKVQQILLKYIENGDITLIGSTTENANFTIFKAVLSRSILIELKALNTQDIISGIERGVELYEKEYDIKIEISKESLTYISEISSGDMRRALNVLELAFNSKYRVNIKEINIILEDLLNFNISTITNYDKDGDSHYNSLSYLQKSIRGSDADASIHALARLIKSGDINSICRRLLVIASEDVGLAYPQGISIVKACVDTALMVGFPEARIPLAEATILLATAPKSNSAYLAIDRALEDLNNMDVGRIPSHLLDKNTNESKYNKTIYKYPHDYDNNYVKQQYMPEKLMKIEYYIPQNNKYEENIKKYWKIIKD